MSTISSLLLFLFCSVADSSYVDKEGEVAGEVIKCRSKCGPLEVISVFIPPSSCRITLGLYGCAVLIKWLCLVFSFLSACMLKDSWFFLRWEPGPAVWRPDLCQNIRNIFRAQQGFFSTEAIGMNKKCKVCSPDISFFTNGRIHFDLEFKSNEIQKTTYLHEHHSTGLIHDRNCNSSCLLCCSHVDCCR